MIHRANIQPGFTCVGSNGANVGTVREVFDTYFRCDTGLLGLGQDLFIPLTSVDHIEGSKIFLQVPADRVSQMGWSQPPAEARPTVGAGTTGGFYGPMPGATETAGRPSVTRHRVQQGFTCTGSDNKKIGTVKEVYDTYFHCDTGFLGLGPDLYIPFDVVNRVEGENVSLNVPSDRVHQQGWDRRPGVGMR
ncbi:MAG: DUF2171 domain-containing protein [Chloroflexi bacterium]|nr:DUF2171 domain-containing protein [Chloroflexota bacterium]